MTPVVQYLDELEIGLCVRINQVSRSRLIRKFFSVISRLGDGIVWLAAGGVVLALNGRQSIPYLLQTGITALLGILVYKALKNRLVRERPYVYHRQIVCGAAPLDRYSFPSGHTLHAANFTIMLTWYEPALTIAVIPFALLVAASRVVLGLHYPSDVFVGAAIGASLATASIAFA